MIERVSCDTVCLTWTVDKSFNCVKLGQEEPKCHSTQMTLWQQPSYRRSILQTQRSGLDKETVVFTEVFCVIYFTHKGQEAWVLEPAGPGGKSELPEENQRLLGTLELKATTTLMILLSSFTNLWKDIWCTWEKFWDRRLRENLKTSSFASGQLTH